MEIQGAEYPYQPAVESMPEYEKQLMDKQDVKKVEIISGATTTGEKFKDAATNALEKAAKNSRKKWSWRRIRTLDLSITNRLLYP